MRWIITNNAVPGKAAYTAAQNRDGLFGFALGGERTGAWVLAIRNAGVTTFNELVAYIQQQVNVGNARYIKAVAKGKRSDIEGRAQAEFRYMVESGNLYSRTPIPAEARIDMQGLIAKRQREAAR